MSIMDKISVIIRSFQIGAGRGKVFNQSLFKKSVCTQIKNILTYDLFDKVIVLTNGDTSTELGEATDRQNRTYTSKAIEEAFKNEINKKRLFVHTCNNWGENPGSATALNEGITLSRNFSSNTFLFIWSPELNIDYDKIACAIRVINDFNLEVVGFLREKWQEKIQWQVIQNTAALWRVSSLIEINGFDPKCNGSEGEVISLEKFGNVRIAGMEDFHAMLRLLKIRPTFLWGMVGSSDPLIWDTNFKPGSERERNHLIKVKRQYLVMKKYAEVIFPEYSFDELIYKLFLNYYQD